jgi:multidrug efflux pump subunit AcrB
MSLLVSVLSYRRLVIAAVLLLSILGAFAWQTMNRQEDPFFPYRYGQISVVWPGAEPLDVERLVLNPLEEKLSEIDVVNELQSSARMGVANIILGMHQHVYDTDTAWQRIRVAIEEAERDFPPGTEPPDINERSMDTQAIVLAITGSENRLELLEAARKLRRELFAASLVERIEILADPEEQVLLRVDDAAMLQAGLSRDMLASQLHADNQVVPGGSLVMNGRYLVLQPQTRPRSIQALQETLIRTPEGDLVPLSALAAVERQPAEPAGERLWWNDEPAVGLALVMPESRANQVHIGEAVREMIESRREAYAPLHIREMFYQPAWVEARLKELGRSLLLGVSIVAVLLLLTMGWRLGLTVSLMLPLVTLSSIAVYAIGGGVLHQMAVAGLVIALGMLVDNAIVMVENIQWHLDQGRSRQQAVTRSVRELAAPLATATLTTLAAFMPLLLAKGDTGDFTRAIPVTVMLVLAVSYVYAVLATPTVASMVLRPSPRTSEPRVVGLGRYLGGFATTRPFVVLVASVLALLGSLSLAGWVDRDFFPSTDRNQMIVDLHFPEGTHPELTSIQALGLADMLRQHPKVEEVHTFTGTTGPKFYYNLLVSPRTPHRARLAVVTTEERDIQSVIDWIDQYGPEQVPEARIVPRRLGQGPPVEAPVELHVYSENLADLAQTAERVLREVRKTPGVRDARHNLSEGLPALVVEVDRAEAQRHGISRAEIAESLFAATRGQTVAQWREGREPAPVRLRHRWGEQLGSEALEGIMLSGVNGPVPLGQLVTTRLSLQPAVIQHRDLQRKAAVLGNTDPGVTYNQVYQDLMPRLNALELPAGARVAIGGAAEEAGEANSALFSSLPIGGLLLLVTLLLQFNSFRRVGMVMVTVPLAAIGVIPGLIITDQPFSFTAMLGVVALVGIVVNNAIVLLELIGQYQADGLGRDQAITEAVSRRIRPILLTTATTIAGLLPLTFTSSTLWPPMAWAIISGLLVSSLMTVLVVPALYRLLIKDSRHAMA